jgi:hypothetical protein
LRRRPEDDALKCYQDRPNGRGDHPDFGGDDPDNAEPDWIEAQHLISGTDRTHVSDQNFETLFEIRAPLTPSGFARTTCTSARPKEMRTLGSDVTSQELHLPFDVRLNPVES